MKAFRILISFVFVLGSSVSFAQKKHHHHDHGHHRSHGAHQHGVGELAISFEGQTGAIELRAPSESFVGFEHVAKTEAEKKSIAEAQSKLETQIDQMISFEAALGCKIEKGDVKVVREKKKSKHSEFEAKYKVACEKSPVGSILKINFVGHFSGLKTVDTTVLVDSLQKSLKVTGTESSLILK